MRVGPSGSADYLSFGGSGQPNHLQRLALIKGGEKGWSSQQSSSKGERKPRMDVVENEFRQSSMSDQVPSDPTDRFARDSKFVAHELLNPARIVYRPEHRVELRGLQRRLGKHGIAFQEVCHDRSPRYTKQF